MKRKFLAVAMMVVMTATLVACSGKDASKENTTAGANDSAVEATTGTTTQDVAESNEETTTPDVSEVEEDQVGETNESNTSTGTLGGESPLVGEEPYSLTDPELFDVDACTLYSPNGNLSYNAWVHVSKYKDSNDALYMFKYRPEPIGKTINMALRAPYMDSNDLRMGADDDGFVWEALEKHGSNDYYQYFLVEVDEDLGDLSSNEAWQAQLDREWVSVTTECQALNYEDIKGDFVDVVHKGDRAIFVIRDITITNFRKEGYTVRGYYADIIDRENGTHCSVQYYEDEAHYNDSRAYNVIKSLQFAETKFPDAPELNF